MMIASLFVFERTFLKHSNNISSRRSRNHTQVCVCVLHQCVRNGPFSSNDVIVMLLLPAVCMITLALKNGMRIEWVGWFGLVRWLTESRLMLGLCTFTIWKLVEAKASPPFIEYNPRNQTFMFKANDRLFSSPKNFMRKPFSFPTLSLSLRIQSWFGCRIPTNSGFKFA